MHSRLVTPSNRRYVLAALALGVLSMAAHSATGDAVDGTHSAAVTQEMTPFLDAHQGSESLQSLVAMLKDLISATFPELESKMQFSQVFLPQVRAWLCYCGPPVTFSYLQLSQSKSLVIFLVKCLRLPQRAEIFPTEDAFVESCSSLLQLGESTGEDIKLPEIIKRNAATGGATLIGIVLCHWRACALHIRHEFRETSNEKQFQLDMQAAQRKMELDAQAAQRKMELDAQAVDRTIQTLLSATVADLQSGLEQPLTTPLHWVQDILASEDDGDNPDHTAVKTALSWLVHFCGALHGGQASFKQWLLGATSVVGQEHAFISEARMAHEYQSIEREKEMPGEFVGGRLQQQVGSSWQDVRMEDLKPSHGMLRVLATYSNDSAEEMGGGSSAAISSPEITEETFCVGLLVRVPALHQNKSEKAGIVSAELQVEDAGGQLRPVRVRGTPVRVAHVALTVPRLHFFLHVAHCFETNSRGVLLSGVHGSGKTTMLRALVGILSSGQLSSIMYRSDARHLLRAGPRALIQSAAFGSDALARQLWSGKYNRDALSMCFREAWEFFARDDRAQDDVQREVLTKFLQAMETNHSGSTCSVVVLDEVNKMLTEIKYHKASRPASPSSESHSSAASAAHEGGLPRGRFIASVKEEYELWCKWLTWDTYGTNKRFRILAGSPHGKRESVKEFGGGFSVQFELRPAPADHVAAIMQCAPVYLGGDPKLFGSSRSGTTGAASGAGTDPLAADISPSVCLDVCLRLGGNARAISSLLLRSDLQNLDVLQRELERVYTAMVRDLAGRFTECLESGKKTHLRPASDSLMSLALTDASLVVRRQVDEDDPRVLVGRPALHAILQAMHEQIFKGREKWAQIFESLKPVDFESAMVLAVAVGAASTRSWPLELLATDSNEQLESAVSEFHKNTRQAGFGVLQWSGSTAASSVDVAIRPIMSSFDAASNTVKTKKGKKTPKEPRSILSGKIVCPLLSLDSVNANTRERFVFNTVTSFPGVDIVCIDVIGIHVQVTFFEVTRSTLENHSKGRGPVPARIPGSTPDPESSKPDAQVQVHPQLRDIFASMGTGHRTASLESEKCVKLGRQGLNTEVRLSGSRDVTKVQQQDDLTKGTSLVNCLLATLGIPLLVKRTFVYDSPVTLRSDQPVLCGLQLELVKSDKLCDQLYGQKKWFCNTTLQYAFRMVYVSDTPIQDNKSPNYAGLMGISQPGRPAVDFVHGVFSDDLCMQFELLAEDDA